MLANENPRTLIKADATHNALPQNTNSQNLLIKGDNLEVLKHLMGAYSEQVKMIYIDPPYNTGSDGFVYADDRKFTVEQLSQLAGIDEDEAKRILEFTLAKSNSHSAWLTFMYPRLYIARQLLRDDGVIFISIDDNEQAQLKVLCDEVFGEENFLGLFIVNSTPNARDYGHIGKMHEFTYMYAKDGEKTITYELEEVEKVFKYQDAIGGFNIHPLYNSNEAFTNVNRPNLYYPFYLNPIVNIDGFYDIGLKKEEAWIEIFPPKSEKNKVQFVWRWGQDKAFKNINIEIIGYKTDNGDFRIVQKMRHTSKLIRSLLTDTMFSTRRGTAEVESIFSKKIFSFPKSTDLIKTFLKISTNEDDICLDFFAGSGTTAHAVMQLNAEDGGNRQFICVQLPETTAENSEAFKADYKTIFDITHARITKAAAKIKAENPTFTGDLGFKVFETMPVFDGYLNAPETLTENLTLFDANTLNQDERHTLMRTWALQDNVQLQADLNPVKLGDYTAYGTENILYFIEPNISLSAVVALLERLDNNPNFKPTMLVVFGYLLDSKTQREMTEAIKQYNNRKGIVLALDIRF